MKGQYTIRDFIALLTQMADAGWEGRVEYSTTSTYGVKEDVQTWSGKFTRGVPVSTAFRHKYYRSDRYEGDGCYFCGKIESEHQEKIVATPAYDLAREAARKTDEERSRLGLDRV